MEKTILVAVKQSSQSKFDFQESVKELELLAKTASAEVVHILTQEMKLQNPATYIGKGKVQELKQAVETFNPNLVIFNDLLQPTQERNLSKILGVKVIDRTTLILDIFAIHAKSREGKVQVELAQYEYLLPRLTGKGIALSRMAGGIGTRRGPGETKLEVDKRKIRHQVQHLKKQLFRIEKQRSTQRKKRSSSAYRVSLVGYTNSGKSTLLNKLTNSKVEVEDKLFSTLDSTTRRLFIEGQLITITDTVGFIDKLPTELIESFKSTLSEVVEADLILHVVNSESANYENQINIVSSILRDLKCAEKPKLVFNKIDIIDDQKYTEIRNDFDGSFFISALEGIGVEKIKNVIIGKIKTLKMDK